MKLPDDRRRELEKSVRQLRTSLGENARSIILYGSAVRGGYNPFFSDINLLIVLQASTASAHGAIRDAIAPSRPRIAPFIVELREMPRAIRVFALKFLSIRRDYELLHGADPLESLDVPGDLEILLAEQELRNLRMRLVNRHVTAGSRSDAYLEFAISVHSKVILALSDAVRTRDIALPHGFGDRDDVLARELGVDLGVIRELERRFGKGPGERESLDVESVHARLIAILGKTLSWMEAQHPKLPL